MKPAGRRRKGHDFERWLATALRETFPGADARRSMQSAGAVQSDVVITGAGIADRIWWECCHANSVPVMKKLQQAVRDATASGESRLPVVVWKETDCRTVRATTYLSVLGLLGLCGTVASGCDAVVTMELGELLGALVERERLAA